MAHEEFLAERENGSIRVMAYPWLPTQRDGGHGFVLDARHFPPGPTDLGRQRLLRGLDELQLRRLAAVHTAGHLVAAYAAGLAVPARVHHDHVKVCQYTLGDDAARLPVEVRVMILTAGQVAAQMWLEVTGRLTVERHFLTMARAELDHDSILELDTARPTAFLYGPASAPAAFDGDLFRIEDQIALARSLLTARWHQVTALAEHITKLRLGPGQLRSILDQPAPAVPAFDAQAAEHGALIAGIPAAAIEAIVDWWTEAVGERIALQSAKDAAILTAHPERAETAGWEGGLTYTRAQQDAFRSSLREQLRTAVSQRLERADRGLSRGSHGLRGTLELSHDLTRHEILLTALGKVGPGRYQYMAPFSTTSVLAPDAAWNTSRDRNAAVLLWSLQGEAPECTREITIDGSSLVRCSLPLLHDGQCAHNPHPADPETSGPGF